MKRWQNWLAVTICALFLSSCAGTWGRIPAGLERDGRYDYSTVHFSGGLERYMSSFPEVEAKGRPVFVDDKGEKIVAEEQKIGGHAVIIPPYVLTVAHVVDLREVTIPVITPFGTQQISAYSQGLQDDIYFLHEHGSSEKISLEKIAIVPEEDWALLKMPDSAVFNYPILPLGRSEELRPGHVIYLLGSPLDLGFEIRAGIVSSLNPKIDDQTRSSTLALYGHLYGYDLTISVSIPVTGGDSGSRVVALRDGQLEIVGLANARRFNVLGMITPIDTILKQIFAKTGVDLRAINEKNLRNFFKK